MYLRKVAKIRQQSQTTRTQRRIGEPSTTCAQTFDSVIPLSCLCSVYIPMFSLPACGEPVFQSIEWPNPDIPQTQSGNQESPGMNWLLPLSFKQGYSSRVGSSLKIDPRHGLITTWIPRFWPSPQNCDPYVSRMPFALLFNTSKVSAQHRYTPNSTKLPPTVSYRWERTYTGGFPLRPKLINSEAVQKTLQLYAKIWESNHPTIRWAWFPCNSLRCLSRLTRWSI